jgi:biopolymer transport protein ExbD
MAGGGANDLNLIPYMDIVVTLVVTMVFFTAIATDVRTASIEAPSYGPEAGATHPLTLFIHADGFELADADSAVRIPRRGAAWPYAALTEALRAARTAGDTTRTLELGADPAVPYSVVVATLDAARADAAGKLFPSVALAVAAR